MNVQEELSKAVEVFTNLKRTICSDDGGRKDLMPMVHFKYKHLKVCCGGILSGNPFELFPAFWRKILDQGIPEFMMLVIEGYSCPTIPENYKRGCLERDFKENSYGKVIEVITIHAIEMNTGDQFTAIIPYNYDDQGLPNFDKPLIGSCKGDSLTANVPAMFAACRDATINFLKEEETRN